MEHYNVTPKGCLIRFVIIMIAEVVTMWLSMKVFGSDEGMALLAVICVFAVIMVIASKYDKYANPYDKRFFSKSSDAMKDEEVISAVCPYCYHINYVVDDDGYCKCEKCGTYFQKQDFDPQ